LGDDEAIRLDSGPRDEARHHCCSDPVLCAHSLTDGQLVAVLSDYRQTLP
jgi:hypothetical protein